MLGDAWVAGDEGPAIWICLDILIRIYFDHLYSCDVCCKSIVPYDDQPFTSQLFKLLAAAETLGLRERERERVFRVFYPEHLPCSHHSLFYSI